MELLGEGAHTSECINWRYLLVLTAIEGKKILDEVCLVYKHHKTSDEKMERLT